MALTVSSITAEFMKDTKTIGKQAAYLDFDFGGRIHHTETLKKAGKSATWEHPVQLTGAGVNMKIIAKATKALGKDNILGEAEINVVKAVGQGMQTVTLHEPHSRELGGRVSFIISGGSQAISGLPHTEGMGSEAAGMIPGHSHEPTGAGGFGGQQEAGLGQQSGLEHGGHGREALAGAGAGTGAAGLGASALHHHHQGTGSEPAAMTPGHTHERTGAGGLGGRQEAGLGQQSGLEHGGHGREALAGAGAGAGAAGVGGPALHHHPGEQGHSYNTGRPLEGSGGQTMSGTHTQGVALGGSPTIKQRISRDLQGGQGMQGGGGVGGTGMSPGSNPSDVHGNQGAPCDHCQGTGNIGQKMQQGLNMGGNTTGGGTSHMR